MKTYLLPIPQRLKQHSKVFDVKAVLCKNAWDTINDEGQTQVMIFHNDGSLIVSTNGNVTICDWRIEPLVGTIIISFKDHSDMYNAMMVQNILVLAKDGSNEVISLVDRENRGIIPNRTVHELTAYFDYQDKQIELQIEQEKQRKQIQIEQEKQKEWERIKLLSMKQRERTALTTFCLENKENICSKYREENPSKIVYVVGFVYCIALILWPFVYVYINEYEPWYDLKNSVMELAHHVSFLSIICIILEIACLAGSIVFGIKYIIEGIKEIIFNHDNNNIAAIVRTEYTDTLHYLSDSEITSIAQQTLGMDF